MPFVNVFISKVVCRDRETIEGKDHFGVAGAAIIDGKPNVFVMPAQLITRNETIQYWPNTLYNGHSDTLRIGLSILAWDIDNNDKWAKARDDAAEISEVVASIVELLPLPPPVGDVAATVIENWPKAVDFFVSLDDDDELGKWAGYVDFPLPAPNSTGYTQYELKFSKDDPTGISRWDYSIFFGVVASNPQPFTNTPQSKRTPVPMRNSKKQMWLGKWESENFIISISQSPDHLTLLKLNILPKNGIAPPAELFGFIAISEITGVEVPAEPAEPVSRQQAMMLYLSEKNFIQLSQDRTAWGIAIPQPGNPRTSGGDFISLEDGSYLEIFDILADGEPANDYELRYVRPAAPDSIGLPAEEMLKKILV